MSLPAPQPATASGCPAAPESSPCLAPPATSAGHLHLLVEAGLANPDGTCTVEQTRRILLAELIIDFFLEWNER